MFLNSLLFYLNQNDFHLKQIWQKEFFCSEKSTIQAHSFTTQSWNLTLSIFSLSQSFTIYFMYVNNTFLLEMLLTFQKSSDSDCPPLSFKS